MWTGTGFSKKLSHCLGTEKPCILVGIYLGTEIPAHVRDKTGTNRDRTWTLLDNMRIAREKTGTIRYKTWTSKTLFLLVPVLSLPVHVVSLYFTVLSLLIPVVSLVLFLRIFSGLSQDFLQTFSGLSQDFLRTFSDLSPHI